MRKLNLLILLFSFGITIIYAQQDHKSIKDLRTRVSENADLVLKDETKACQAIDGLLEEAVIEEDTIIELRLLSNRLWCLYRQMDMEGVLEFSKYVKEKAIEYNSPSSEALAHFNISLIYEENEMYDLAMEEVNKTIPILKRADPSDPHTFYAYINFNLLKGDIYLHSGDPKNALYYYFQAERKNKEKNIPAIQPQIDYNIANAYLTLNIDSAEYFAQRSIENDIDSTRTGLLFLKNSIIRGEVYLHKKEHTEAINQFSNAEKIISPHKHILKDTERIYKGMVEAYRALGNTDKTDYYQNKLQGVQLDMASRKNNSLRKIIIEDMGSQKNYSAYIIIGSAILLLVMVILMIRLRRKNKLLQQQEKISEQYLQENKTVQFKSEELLSRLMEMVQNNDPAFMVAFHEAFPDFMEKLKAVNDKIVPTEIEFCALMKLNLSTKEIARYWNIEPKSVHNKKYRIRKKLGISNDTDIYYWFSKL